MEVVGRSNMWFMIMWNIIGSEGVVVGIFVD